MAGNAMEVRIIGFRGVADDPRYQNEPALIKVGHVGISLDGGHTIYGFHPTPEALASFPSPEAAYAHLRARNDLSGGVYDDTAIFWRAMQLAQSGARTTVWQQRIPVSAAEHARIAQELQHLVMAGGRLGARYRFPDKSGVAMPAGANNCATWPRELGLPIPEPTGRLRHYIALLQAGEQSWP